MFDPDYAPLREIGRRFGVSNQTVGRWLAELGWRTVGKKPSFDAIVTGLVKRVPVNRGYENLEHYIWHIERTVVLLEEASHVQV